MGEMKRGITEKIEVHKKEARVIHTVVDHKL